MVTTLKFAARQLELSRQQIEAYHQNGYFVIHGLISPEEAAALHDEVMDIMQIIGFEMTKLKQTSEYLAGSLLDKFINSRQLQSVAEQLLGGASTVYLPFTAVKSGGGGGRFHFHQDNQYTTFNGPGLNLWTALGPMNTDNGCLQIVPGSHRQGTLKWVASGDGDTHKKIEWEPSDFIPIIMEAGDCVAFDRNTIHGSGQNMTSESRVGYAVQFHRDDVTILDAEGQVRLLKDFPKWPTKPVTTITPPQGSIEGH